MPQVVFSHPTRSEKTQLPADSQNRRSVRTQNLLASGAVPLVKQPTQGENLPLLESGDWRLKIYGAAVVKGEKVKLGEIASPLGDVINWASLSQRELWPSPPEEGKPLQINRSNLSQALHEYLGKEIAGRCILPTSLVIQRGGALAREDDLRAYIVKSLTPQLRAMPGEAEITEFNLPDYIFLAHSAQRIQLEVPRLAPGRVSVRFAVQEADGTILRRVSGAINLTQWVTVPAASRTLNKGDALTPDAVTFLRVNARRLREPPWDGQGGPWQTTRSLATGEPILQSDLANQFMVRKGQIVNLIFARGNLRLRTQAEALNDGEPGMTIPVRNLQTKKQVFATVKDNMTVEIR